MICIAFVSCNNDDQSTESNSLVKEEVKVLEFTSEEKMEEKIDEITAMKSGNEKIAMDNFNKSEALKGFNVNIKKTNESDIKKQNEAILSSLKVYHGLILSSIYELRRQLNFTSIQSIADEINSLSVIDFDKSKSLKETYQNLLKKDPITGLVTTIFDGRTSNVLNVNGKVLINGQKLDYAQYSSIPNETGRYIGDEATIGGEAVNQNGYAAFYHAGREIHRNDLGVKFFRYYTQLTTVAVLQVSPYVVATPSTFIVDPVSAAGFALSNTNTIGDYAFTQPFISGSGDSFVRDSGGKKNNAYVPVGGRLKATFTSTIGGVYKEISCDFSYTEQ